MAPWLLPLWAAVNRADVHAGALWAVVNRVAVHAGALWAVVNHVAMHMSALWAVVNHVAVHAGAQISGHSSAVGNTPRTGTTGQQDVSVFSLRYVVVLLETTPSPIPICTGVLAFSTT